MPSECSILFIYLIVCIITFDNTLDLVTLIQIIIGSFINT